MKLRLSGWARIWVVIGGVIWGWGTLYGAKEGLESIYASPAEKLGYVGAYSLFGLFYGLALFTFAMFVKWVGLWIWRGFQKDRATRKAVVPEDK